VPGVICANGPGGDKATYPTYQAFVRETQSKIEKFEESYTKMNADITN
jgi:hypothetical protein